jgi:hypothetical protein
MSVRDLAERLGRAGEYRLVYAGCSAWAHGDASSTQWASHWGSNPEILFIACVGYYARMLLKLADVGRAVLTAGQHEFLAQASAGFG